MTCLILILSTSNIKIFLVETCLGRFEPSHGSAYILANEHR